MKIGDILEWLAGAGFTYTAYASTNKAWPAVLVGCLFLAYQAQCYAHTDVTRPKLHLPRTTGKKRPNK